MMMIELIKRKALQMLREVETQSRVWNIFLFVFSSPSTQSKVKVKKNL